MKTKDIASRYAVSGKEFEGWIKERSEYRFSTGMMGGVDVADDQDIAAIVEHFKRDLAEEAARRERSRAEADRQAAEAAAAAAEAARLKREALASMLITSGFNFDGYRITKYSGYISGDDAISMDRPSHGWLGGVNKDVASDLLSGLVQIRRNALAELKEAAYALGCNAVIGVDFDYLTLDPETATNQGGTLYLPFLFAVTANGNAVVIEPE
jgi:uncharacterized protein YbjQ (UPF0145 family)